MCKCENIDGQCASSWCDCDYQRRKRDKKVSKAKSPETWQDSRGQTVYVKGSPKNKTDRLIKSEFEGVRDLLSGVVTRKDTGKKFYAPFHRGDKCG